MLTLLHLFLALSSFFHHTNSLPTVSISSNSQTPVICALNQQSHLSCTIPIPRGAANLSFSRIVGGNGFLCALRSPPSDPSVSVILCLNTTAPSGFKRIYRGPALSDLTSGSSHLCGVIRQSNRIQCWRWKNFRFPFGADQSFSSVSVGNEFLCGLNSSGNIICNGSVKGQAPAGSFAAVEAGPHYACALTADGSPSCWGQDGNFSVAHAPGGERFTSFALGESRACGLRANGTVACWGQRSNFTLPADAEFVAIEYRGSVFCGVLSANLTLACWGRRSSSSMIFDNVLPGACSNSSSCKCGIMPPSESFCGSGQSVCSPCLGVSSSTPASPPPESSRKSSRWSGKMIAFLVVGIVGCISLAASIAVWRLVLRQGNGRSSSRVHDSGRLDNEEPQPEETTDTVGAEEEVTGEVDRRRPVLEKRLSRIVSMASIEEFPLQVLLQATNNFSPELKIGNGSYGSVYKAELHDGRTVAIKRAEVSVSNSAVGNTTRKNEERDTAFVAELEFLSKLNHKNLVRLLGFYEDAKERVLIYDYMANGTLHDHLHHPERFDTRSPLKTWPGRIKVALDAARGIEYLHMYAVPPVIHRDIKPSNILLDESWTAKVSDFGLSLMGPGDEEPYLSLLAAGTLGYIDPEYYRRHQLTVKSDVYSFGVVILELLTGLKAIHLNENGSPRNVVDFVKPYVDRDEIHRVLDPRMEDPTPVEITAVERVGQLASECVHPESRYRPSMADIVGSLDAAWRIASYPPTFFSSSSLEED